MSSIQYKVIHPSIENLAPANITFPDDVWGIIKDYMIDYTHKNLTYENYEFDKVDNSQFIDIKWDYKNTKLDKIMMNDSEYYENDKQNLMWIAVIKEKFNWERGEKIHLHQMCKTDGMTGYGKFYIIGNKTILRGVFSEFYIDENGFVFRQYSKWNQDKKEMISTMEKVDCMYNKLLKCDE